MQRQGQQQLNDHEPRHWHRSSSSYSSRARVRRRIKKDKTDAPTFAPTGSPSTSPSQLPTSSHAPSDRPSHAPTTQPSIVPTTSMNPSSAPSLQSALQTETHDDNNVNNLGDGSLILWVPTGAPSASQFPSVQPSSIPSHEPSIIPSMVPTEQPSTHPSRSMIPSPEPSMMPSVSLVPTESVTSVPSVNPSSQPSDRPTVSPTAAPTGTPSSAMPTTMTTPPSFTTAATSEQTNTNNQPTLLDPRGFVESQVRDGTGGGEVFTCNRDAKLAVQSSAGLSPPPPQPQKYLILYNYTMALHSGANVIAATLEGETLIGRGVAEQMCDNANTNADTGPNFALQRLYTRPPDSILGTCGSSSSQLTCFRVSGAFTVDVYHHPSSVQNGDAVGTSSHQDNDDRRRMNMNNKIPPTSIQLQFLQVIEAVLPSVVETLAEFESPATRDQETPTTTTAGNDIVSPDENKGSLFTNSETITITGGIVGGAAALCIMTMGFLVRNQQRRRHDYDGDDDDDDGEPEEQEAGRENQHGSRLDVHKDETEKEGDLVLGVLDDVDLEGGYTRPDHIYNKNNRRSPHSQTHHRTVRRRKSSMTSKLRKISSFSKRTVFSDQASSALEEEESKLPILVVACQQEESSSLADSQFTGEHWGGTETITEGPPGSEAADDDDDNDNEGGYQRSRGEGITIMTNRERVHTASSMSSLSSRSSSAMSNVRGDQNHQQYPPSPSRRASFLGNLQGQEEEEEEDDDNILNDQDILATLEELGKNKTTLVTTRTPTCEDTVDL